MKNGYEQRELDNSGTLSGDFTVGIRHIIKTRIKLDSQLSQAHELTDRIPELKDNMTGLKE